MDYIASIMYDLSFCIFLYCMIGDFGGRTRASLCTTSPRWVFAWLNEISIKIPGALPPLSFPSFPQYEWGDRANV